MGPEHATLVSTLAAGVSTLIAAWAFLRNRRKQQVDESSATAALLLEVAKTSHAEATAAHVDLDKHRRTTWKAEALAHRLQSQVDDMKVEIQVLQAESRAWRTWCSQDPPCLVRDKEGAWRRGPGFPD